MQTSQYKSQEAFLSVAKSKNAHNPLKKLYSDETTIVSKFCSQQDLTKIPRKNDTEQKAYDAYAANDINENVVSDSYETICMLSSKAMTL